jgi:hypothetical protein
VFSTGVGVYIAEGTSIDLVDSTNSLPHSIEALTSISTNLIMDTPFSPSVFVTHIFNDVTSTTSTVATSIVARYSITAPEWSGRIAMEMYELKPKRFGVLWNRKEPAHDNQNLTGCFCSFPPPEDFAYFFTLVVRVRWPENESANGPRPRFMRRSLANGQTLRHRFLMFPKHYFHPSPASDSQAAACNLCLQQP